MSLTKKKSVNHHILLDGFILIASSCFFVLCIDGGMSLFKDKKNDGNPLLTSIIQASSQIDAKEGRKETNMKEILENMGTVNRADGHGDTVLMMVCYANFDNCLTTMTVDAERAPYVSLLQEKGADIHLRDKDGWSALTWAAWSGMTECADILIKAGADVNLVDRQNNTILAIAAQQGNMEIVKILLEKGVDPKIKNKLGMDALALAKLEWDRYSASASSSVLAQAVEMSRAEYDSLVQASRTSAGVKEEEDKPKAEREEAEKDPLVDQAHLYRLKETVSLLENS